MTRRVDPQLAFDALSLEGALLPPEWLARIASLGAPAQSPTDYGIPKGLQLRDEIGRYWRIAGALWSEFAAARDAADRAGVTRRFVLELLSQVFGFTSIESTGLRGIDGRVFPIDFEARDGRVPIVVCPFDRTLDQSTAQHGDEHRRRSAWGALQEYLNAAEGALWGVATNGVTLRLGRDNTSLTRPAWLEADLERIFTEERYADFSVLWLVLHASRFGRRAEGARTGRSTALTGSDAGAPPLDPSQCALELWRDAGREEGSRARESLRVGVEQALLSLGDGFLPHPANSALRDSLASGELSPVGYFNELLRLVYRMIFLLTVEERGILHPPGVEADIVELYAGGYGMRRLRDRSLRHSARDKHGDLWLSLRPVFAGLGRAEGEPALGLPGIGGLFEPEQCPHLDTSALSNSALLAAVFRLAWLPADGTLVRVNWKDMGVEEFGSVYESLLELVPVVSEGGRHFQFAGSDESAGNARKLSGSYYTPDSLVQQLLDTALEPVVAERLSRHAQAADRERELLSLSVIDPACGSGHFLLAAARRLADHLARLRSGGTPGAEEYRHALRDVVTHCIYGVDRNPMALELARMALWLEAYTPDRALGFLDHHLVCGDALLGLLDLSVMSEGIPDVAYRPLTGDDRNVVKLLAKMNRAARREMQKLREQGQLTFDFRAESIAEAFAGVEAVADTDLPGVEVKRLRYEVARNNAEASTFALAADCYLGAFLTPKRLPAGEAPLTELRASQRFPLSGTLGRILDGTLSADYPAVSAAQAVCRGARVLHWPLAFPHVFERGGFDIVLGNPPWERLKLQEQEFFAVRAPEVANARNKAAREREIAKLASAALGTPERATYDEFERAKQLAEAGSAFCHAAARFEATGVGDVNTYALFAETAYRLTAPIGRAGLVVPTGIATDDSTKEFFREIAVGGRLVSLYDFENRAALFPGVHRSYKFCLLTIGEAARGEFAFFATRVADLADARRRYRLAPVDFALINPNTKTCPTFRSEFDAELTKRIYQRVPVLIDETESEGEGNPWGLSFTALFHMANDSGLFLDAPVAGAVPLYEAKMIHQYDHRWATYGSVGGGFVASSRHVTATEKEDPDFMTRPRYWVRNDEVSERLAERGWKPRWLVAWRNVCRSTDERTGIFAVLPRVAAGNSLLLMLPASCNASDVALLLGCMNSAVCDYVVRQKVAGVNYTFGYLRQIPMPAPGGFSPHHREFVASRVLELTYTACDLTPWARDLDYGGPPFPWDPDRRALLRADLDAYYAHLYGLTRDELRYILDPADVMGPDYPSETFRVLKHKEEREFGEYRTRRLVLEAWDRIFGG